LKKLRDEKLGELENEKKPDVVEKLRQEIKEIEIELSELEEAIKWMKESGDELEIEEEKDLE